MTGREIKANLLLVAVSLLLIVAAGLLGWRLAGLRAEQSGPSRPPRVQLAAFEDGRPVGLEEYAGQIVVVDFWATWCGPCVLQARILTSLQEELARRGVDQAVQFLAVNLGEDRERIERYMVDHPFTYPVLMDPEERLGLSLEIFTLPTVMVLDRSGRIVFLRPGIADRGVLAEVLSAVGVEGLEGPQTSARARR